MRNKYSGKCQLCGNDVPPKQGRWHEQGYENFGRNAQKFSGLRCFPCSNTSKKGEKETIIMLQNKSHENTK